MNIKDADIFNDHLFSSLYLGLCVIDMIKCIVVGDGGNYKHFEFNKIN